MCREVVAKGMKDILFSARGGMERAVTVLWNFKSRPAIKEAARATVMMAQEGKSK
jgi:hypothetical protein